MFRFRFFAFRFPFFAYLSSWSFYCALSNQFAFIWGPNGQNDVEGRWERGLWGREGEIGVWQFTGQNCNCSLSRPLETHCKSGDKLNKTE